MSSSTGSSICVPSTIGAEETTLLGVEGTGSDGVSDGTLLEASMFSSSLVTSSVKISSLVVELIAGLISELLLEISLFAHLQEHSVKISAITIMKANNFMYVPSQDSAEMYETDTGYYHKTLCFGIERS